MVKVDLSGCQKFFDASGPDFAAAASAHRVLTEKTGQGADFTGWLELPRLIKRTELKGIISAANKIRSRSKALVVVGIGGTSLGAGGAIELLRPIQRADEPRVYFVGNGLSGDYINDIIGQLGDDDFDVNVISKSGTTLEPALSFRVFRELLEKKYGSNIMRELERMCLLRNVDTKWMDHIDAMDQLRQGIYLRSYGQRDPVVEYRLEGFEMFDSMIDSIKEDTVRMLLTIELKIQPQQQAPVVERTQVAKPTGDAATPGKNVKATSSSGPVKVEKIGRNDPCPCGSGLKWKKCTCKEYHPDL